jgi:hypothetical protein
MNKILRIIIVLTVVSIMIPVTYCQDVTESQASSLKFRNKNLGIEKKKSTQKTRRGGKMTYPRGIADKKINFGITLGGDIALMSALSDEQCPLGGNLSLFIHGVKKNTNTIAMGAEIKGFYLLADAEKFANEFKVTGTDVAAPKVKVGNWILGATQFSFLANFNPLPRFNIQLKANVGPLIAIVPKYEATYQYKERQFDGTYKTTTYTFNYAGQLSKTMSIGGAFTVGSDMLYALTKNMEFKVGLDWSYLRFNYSKLYQEKIDYVSYIKNVDPYIEKGVAQFGVFDIHLGFAFSF